jgi:hypothetical protein
MDSSELSTAEEDSIGVFVTEPLSSISCWKNLPVTKKNQKSDESQQADTKTRSTSIPELTVGGRRHQTARSTAFSRISKRSEIVQPFYTGPELFSWSTRIHLLGGSKNRSKMRREY